MTCPALRAATCAAVAPIYVAGAVGEAASEAVGESLPAVPVDVNLDTGGGR